MPPSKRAPKSAPILPNEVWLMIFKQVDTNTLLNLTLVCKHWNQLIFSHIADRFVLRFDIERLQFPRRGIGMVPGRRYRHLSVRSFRLDSLDYVLEIVKQLVTDLTYLKMDLVSLECQILEQLLPLCTRMKELNIKAKYFEYGDVLYNQKPALPTVQNLKFDIENRVLTFKPVTLEMALLPCIPNVQEVSMGIHDPLDLLFLGSMAARIKVLTVTVDYDLICDFLLLRFPVLVSMDLKLEQKYNVMFFSIPVPAFQQFWLPCKELTSLTLDYEFDQQDLSVVFSSLPGVKTLKLYSHQTTHPFSLDGLEQMVLLKKLTLQCLLVHQGFLPMVPIPSVEIVHLNDFVCYNVLSDVLKRFPNVMQLSFPINRYDPGTLDVIAELGPRLKDLWVFDLRRITPEFIADIAQLPSLKRLTIEAYVIARANFRLLGSIMAQPALQSLTIKTSSNIPRKISIAIATANPACKLTLNNELVKPAVAKGRKRSIPASSSSNNGSALPTDESQPSVSSASTSDGSNLSVSSSEPSGVSFSTVDCSSPKEKRMLLDVPK